MENVLNFSNPLNPGISLSLGEWRHAAYQSHRFTDGGKELLRPGCWERKCRVQLGDRLLWLTGGLIRSIGWWSGNNTTIESWKELQSFHSMKLPVCIGDPNLTWLNSCFFYTFSLWRAGCLLPKGSWDRLQPPLWPWKRRCRWWLKVLQGWIVILKGWSVIESLDSLWFLRISMCWCFVLCIFTSIVYV